MIRKMLVSETIGITGFCCTCVSMADLGVQVFVHSFGCVLNPCPAEPGYTLTLQTDLDLHCLTLSM